MHSDILNTAGEDAREQGDLFVLLRERSLGELWGLMNTPRPVDFRGVRLVTSIFFVGYLVAVFLRTGAATPLSIVGLRACVLAYAAFGIYLGRRQTTWRTLRAYMLGMALGLPIVTAYMSSTQSDPATVMSLTGLVTFASLVFVLTPVDLAIAGGVLCVTFFTVIWSSPTVVPPATATVVLIGTLGAGMALSFVLSMYRAAMHERVRWWRDSCGRERALREFSEIATSQSGNPDLLLDRFLDIFSGSHGDARGLLMHYSGEGLTIGSAAGFSSIEDAPGDLLEVPVDLRNSAVTVARILEPKLSYGAAASTAGRGSSPAWPELGVCLALPIVIEGRAAGVVLAVRRSNAPIGGEDLRLLRSLATQIGVAMGCADLISRLRSALNAKGEFVNTMSHELRSPLNVIIGYAEMLSEGHVESTAVAERIRSCGMELLQLIENTMAVAQMGTGKMRLRLETFSLEGLGAELSEHLAALPESQGRSPVQWSVAEDLPLVHLDRLKVKEVIQNLVSNGLKYSDGGPVQVAIKPQGGEIRIVVTDWGRGIPADAQTRIFEVFERLERDRTAATPGVGLGLFIVKNLVDLLHGRIELSSTLGEGTSFAVSLPIEIAASSDFVRDLTSVRAA